MRAYGECFIEDNSDGRAILKMMLELDGHVVEEAADGVGGLERAPTSHPDVVIVDIGLPGMDGYQVSVCGPRKANTDRG
jgi:CheY-like chemotaxis protein